MADDADELPVHDHSGQDGIWVVQLPSEAWHQGNHHIHLERLLLFEGP